MRIPIYLLAVLALSACSNQEKKSINVIGQAEMKVIPDMVEFSLKAYNVKPAMKDAVAQTQTAVNEIVAVCKKYVKDPADIKVSNISTNKAYNYQSSRNEFIGYDATQVLNVTLRDIRKMEQFTEELLATKISGIENVRFNHTKADSIMREINLMALEDAHKTAEKMCDKMRVRLGKITYLSNFEGLPEERNRGMHYSSNDYELNLYNKSFGGRGFKMTAEILRFEDIAHARFEIE